MKLAASVFKFALKVVAPSRGRGLKLHGNRITHVVLTGRPFTGAWIETSVWLKEKPPGRGSPLHGGVA